MGASKKQPRQIGNLKVHARNHSLCLWFEALAREARGDGVLCGTTSVGVARSSGMRAASGGVEKATAPNWELENAGVKP